MTLQQYCHAEEDLTGRLQTMREREGGQVHPVELSGSEEETPHSLDDPIVKSLSSERERARDEFHIYCNVVKPMKYGPKTYVGRVLRLGSIQMGKVGERGHLEVYICRIHLAK